MSNINKVLKNIILISDVKGACVDAILSTGLYNIKLLVVPYKKCVDELKHKYGDKIENYLYYIPDTNTEFQKEFDSNYNLSYIDVIKYRDVQFKCYRHNLRYLFILTEVIEIIFIIYSIKIFTSKIIYNSPYNL